MSTLEHVTELLGQLKSDTEFTGKELKNITLPALRVCACHSESHPWNDSIIRKLSSDLLDTLVQLCRCSSLKQLLKGDEESKFEAGLAKSFLTSNMNSLKKENWKKNPSNKYVFEWCLKNVQYPNMYKILPEILSPSLLFVDDFMVENRILGVKCLTYTIKNVNPTELRLYGRADVMFDALFRLLYSHEAELIPFLYPCILELLPIVNKNPNEIASNRKRDKYDNVFMQVLSNMALTDSIVLRRAYAVYLADFVVALKIRVVRHMKTLLAVIFQYLSVYDGPEENARRNVLFALKELITQAWPRIPCYMEVIIKHLMKFAYDVQTERTLTPKNVNDELLLIVINCLNLLRHTSETEFETHCSSLKETGLPPIQNVLERLPNN